MWDIKKKEKEEKRVTNRNLASLRGLFKQPAVRFYRTAGCLIRDFKIDNSG